MWEDQCTCAGFVFLAKTGSSIASSPARCVCMKGGGGECTWNHAARHSCPRIKFHTTVFNPHTHVDYSPTPLLKCWLCHQSLVSNEQQSGLHVPFSVITAHHNPFSYIPLFGPSQHVNTRWEGRPNHPSSSPFPIWAKIYYFQAEHVLFSGKCMLKLFGNSAQSFQVKCSRTLMPGHPFVDHGPNQENTEMKWTIHTSKS